MHIPVIRTTELNYLKEIKTHWPCNRIRRQEFTENINATKNYDLSENNPQCGQKLNSVDKEHLRNIALDYKTEINKTEINQPCKVLIEHKIILKDDDLVSHPMRRIPYHIRDKVKEIVDDLIENNFVEYSDLPNNAHLVPVLRKNGDIRLYFD